jgi:hypothetical protein
VSTTSTVTVGDLYANVAENVTAGWFTANSLLGSPSTYTATINWGDSSLPTAGIVTGFEGGFQVSGTHTYAATGPYTVQVKVVDAAGTTTVAYEKVQAATAPATPYDGEVATTVGTASGATEAVAVDPGGPDNNGDQTGVPETQAPGSPGVYAYLIPILSAAGALVTVAIPKVEVTPDVKWAGPDVVPGNSDYQFRFNIPPTNVSKINGKWDVEIGAGGKQQGSIRAVKDPATGDWVGFTMNIVLAGGDR